MVNPLTSAYTTPNSDRQIPSGVPFLVGNPLIERLFGESGGVKGYSLTLLERELAAGLNYGDKVQMMVPIPTLTGMQYYSGHLEGTVAYVTKNVMKICVYARHRSVIKQKWLALNRSIVVTGKMGERERRKNEEKRVDANMTIEGKGGAAA